MQKILGILLIGSIPLNADYHAFKNNTEYHCHTNGYKPSIELHFSAGKADRAYNEFHEKTNPLNILGTHNFHFLGIRQQNLTLNKIEAEKIITTQEWGILHQMTDQVITALTNKTDLGTYGQFTINGNFDYKNGNIHIALPHYKNFHVELDIPFSTFSFSDVTYTDHTPATAVNGFSLQNAQWTNFKALLDRICHGYLLSSSNYKEKGLGDIHLGIHYNSSSDDSSLYTDTNKKIYTTVSETLIIPTGKQKNENQAFSCAHGYDGHWGLKTAFKTQVKLNRSLFIQSTIENILFIPNDKVMRLKTYPDQNGFLYLATQNTRRHKGTIINLNTTLFLHHDKIPVDWSFGYNFTHAKKTILHSLNTFLFEDAIINTDKRFNAWTRHAIECACNYRLSNGIAGNFTFSKAVGGKNIFITKQAGFASAFSFSYEF